MSSYLRTMAWRILCAAIGLGAGAFGLAALAFAFSPAFHLEPRPGFEVSLAVIALLVAARFLWWAFRPAPPDQRGR